MSQHTKTRRAVLLAAAGSLLVSVLLPSTVAHADVDPRCMWTSADLPLPPGFTNGSVGNSDGSSNLLAGSVWTDQDTRRQAVIWENGTPRLVGGYQAWNSTTLVDVNSSGVAVGEDSDGQFSTPLRYRNGSFETLPEPAGTSNAWPAAINRSGTVVGTITQAGRRKVIVWPAGDPGTPYLLETATGQASNPAIDESGRIIASTTEPTSYVWSVWGTRAQLTPAQPGWWVAAEDIRAGRVVGTSGSGNGDMAAVEWGVDGRITRVFPGGNQAVAVNTEGVVLGVQQDGNVLRPVVWVDGQLVGPLPLPPNSQQVSARVLTDDGVVFGQYTNSANDIVPVRWTCG